MSEREMTVTDAARHFADLVNRTYYKGESTILIRSGEPVARMIPIGGSSVLGSDFASKWSEMTHMDPDDADDFAESIETSRKNLKMPAPAWD